MKTLRRVQLTSLARMVYLVDLCILLLSALPIGLLAFGLRHFGNLPNPTEPLLVAGMTIIFHPLAAALLAALAGAFYNALAPRVGGIRFEVDAGEG